MTRKPSHLYEFGPFCLNANERILQHNGTTVPLTPKVVDTLLVLVENREHVVTKDDLLQQLWPDTFVEESSLTQNVSLLRRALNESGADRHYIETIPKRGYRFIAAVRETNDSDEDVVLRERTTTEITIEAEQLEQLAESIAVTSTPVRRRTRTVLAAIAAVFAVVATVTAGFLYIDSRARRAPAAPRSLAVLPFKGVGDNVAELQGLGIADALIIRLSKIDQPIILPTSSISRYTNRDKDAIAIGKDLGVDAVLDGTVQRDGQRVRVTAQLIRLSDGKPVWSAKYDEEYSGTFALQDSISGQLARGLLAEISRDGKARTAIHMTDNAAAYEDYLTGIYFWNRRTRENLTKAMQYFEQAVQKDAKFALAHALLSDCYFMSTDPNFELLSMPEGLRRANVEVAKALDLDEGIAEAHTVKAGLLWNNMDLEGADREFRRALEINPNYAIGHVRYSYFLFGRQDAQSALAHMKQAQALDPISPITNTALGFMLFIARDFKGAIGSYQRALEIQPDQHIARINLAETYIHEGMFKEAQSELDRMKEAPGETAGTRAYLAIASGRRDEGLKIINDLRDSNSKDRPYLRTIDYLFLYSLADKDAAFKLLDSISLGPFLLARLKQDPQFDALRSDSRFAAYLKQHHLE
jgi:DNA-binding winged helix-turn-helix (wHTH) protein/TolB-like protein/Flp pilus assembly protein TadD